MLFPSPTPRAEAGPGTLQTLRPVCFSGAGWMYAQFSLSLHLSVPDPPLPVSHSVPNYKLEIQDGQRVGVEVIKPESLGLPTPHPTSTHTFQSLQRLHPRPYPATQLGVDGLDPL